MTESKQRKRNKSSKHFFSVLEVSCLLVLVGTTPISQETLLVMKICPECLVEHSIAVVRGSICSSLKQGLLCCSITITKCTREFCLATSLMSFRKTSRRHPVLATLASKLLTRLWTSISSGGCLFFYCSVVIAFAAELFLYALLSFQFLCFSLFLFFSRGKQCILC